MLMLMPAAGVNLTLPACCVSARFGRAVATQSCMHGLRLRAGATHLLACMQQLMLRWPMEAMTQRRKEVQRHARAAVQLRRQDDDVPCAFD